MTEFHSKNNSSTDLNLRFQLGTGTDIGGGKENQDESFVWIKRERNLMVLGVLDGHGREVGKLAAQAAKKSLTAFLDAEYLQLMQDPIDTLIKAHNFAHHQIKEAFVVELERQGYQVKATEEGYLIKRKSTQDYWTCVHGGTSCSLIALISNSLYIANVGDSSALLCAAHPILTKDNLVFLKDAAIGNDSGLSTLSAEHANTYCNSHLTNATLNQDESTGGSKVLVISAEHSPESAYEFTRLAQYRPRDASNQYQPSLHVVYDSPYHDKSQCQPVFDVTNNVSSTVSSLSLQPTQKGSYYKNVRKEWASLVSTPTNAKFQDALAFTRSLGDLHLHTYGVSHLPEVHKVDLLPIFQTLYQSSQGKDSADSVASNSTSTTTSSNSTSAVTNIAEQLGTATICAVIATDGVWDNWIYEDVGRFMLDASCLNAVAQSADGAQKVMTSFMIRNSQFSKKNFGNQADNATGILLYLSHSPHFAT